MAALAQAMMDGIWFDRSKVEEAEYRYQEYLQGQGDNTKSKKSNTGGGKVVQLIAEARQKIQDSISNYSATLDSPSETTTAASSNQIKALQEENAKLKKTVSELTDKFQWLESRLSVLEKQSSIPATAEPVQAPTPAPVVNGDADDDEDDDVDLFGSSDEDDAEAERIKQERLAKYHDKKSKKPTVIAKSNIILDVKPWDDETDMTALEECVRKVETDGLVWGASKFVKVAYGISKLQITCVVEDDKVGTDFLEESITAFEDYVQSVDIVAFNKV